MANQIQIIEERVTCTSCDRWEWQSSGKPIRHNPNRCADPTAQLVAMPQKAEPRKDALGKYSQDSPASGHTAEEINDALYRRDISMSDAMNTDF